MDPTANLEEQRQIVARLLGDDTISPADTVALTQRLCDLVEALDQWISKGGFLPTQWARK